MAVVPLTEGFDPSVPIGQPANVGALGPGPDPDPLPLREAIKSIFNQNSPVWGSLAMDKAWSRDRALTLHFNPHAFDPVDNYDPMKDPAMMGWEPMALDLQDARSPQELIWRQSQLVNYATIARRAAFSGLLAQGVGFAFSMTDPVNMALLATGAFGDSALIANAAARVPLGASTLERAVLASNAALRDAGLRGVKAGFGGLPIAAAGEMTRQAVDPTHTGQDAIANIGTQALATSVLAGLTSMGQSYGQAGRVFAARTYGQGARPGQPIFEVPGLLAPPIRRLTGPEGFSEASPGAAEHASGGEAAVQATLDRAAEVGAVARSEGAPRAYYGATRDFKDLATELDDNGFVVLNPDKHMTINTRGTVEKHIPADIVGAVKPYEARIATGVPDLIRQQVDYARSLGYDSIHDGKTGDWVIFNVDQLRSVSETPEAKPRAGGGITPGFIPTEPIPHGVSAVQYKGETFEAPAGKHHIDALMDAMDKHGLSQADADKAIEAGHLQLGMVHQGTFHAFADPFGANPTQLADGRTPVVDRGPNAPSGGQAPADVPPPGPAVAASPPAGPAGTRVTSLGPLERTNAWAVMHEGQIHTGGNHYQIVKRLMDEQGLSEAQAMDGRILRGKKTNLGNFISNGDYLKLPKGEEDRAIARINAANSTNEARALARMNLPPEIQANHAAAVAAADGITADGTMGHGPEAPPSPATVATVAAGYALTARELAEQHSDRAAIAGGANANEKLPPTAREFLGNAGDKDFVAPTAEDWSKIAHEHAASGEAGATLNIHPSMMPAFMDWLAETAMQFPGAEQETAGRMLLPENLRGTEKLFLDHWFKKHLPEQSANQIEPGPALVTAEGEPMPEGAGAMAAPGSPAHTIGTAAASVPVGAAATAARQATAQAQLQSLVWGEGIAPPKIGGRVAEFLFQLPDSPIKRGLMSPSLTMREMIGAMTDVGFLQNKHLPEGGFQPSQISVVAEYRSEVLPRIYTAMQATENAYLDYRQRLGGGQRTLPGYFWQDLKNGGRGGVMSFTEFRSEVGWAKSQMGLQTARQVAPEVLDAAGVWEREVFGPLAKTGDQLGLWTVNLRKDLAGLERQANSMRPNTAAHIALQARIRQLETAIDDTERLGVHKAAYLNRVYLRGEIKARRAQFETILQQELGVNAQVAGDITDTVLQSNVFTATTPTAIGTPAAMHYRSLWKVSDQALDGFIERDIFPLGRKYAQDVGTQNAIMRRFGDVNLYDHRQAVIDDYNKLIAAAPDRAAKTALRKQLVKDLADSQAMLEMVTGDFGLAADPTSYTSRAIRMAKNFAAVTKLTGAVSAIGDAGVLVMRNGLASAFKDGLQPFFSGLDDYRSWLQEAHMFGSAVETVMGLRQAAAANLTDAFDSSTRLERSLERLAGVTFHVNLMNQWTDAIKAVTAQVAGTNMLRAIDKLVAGTISDADRTKLAWAFIGPAEAAQIQAAAQRHGWMSPQGVFHPNTGNWNDASEAYARRVFRAALDKEVHNTVISPAPGDRPNWTQKEWGSLVTQFKGFSFAATQRIMMSGLQQPDAHMLNGLMVLVALGAVIDTIRSKDKKRSVADRLIGAIDRSGAMGYIMDAFQASRRFFDPKTGFVGKAGIMGPTASEVASLAKMGGDATVGSWGHQDNAAVLRLLPWNAVFYLDWAAHVVAGGGKGAQQSVTRTLDAATQGP